MALRLSASELPKLLTWLQQQLPATFKLHGELKSHMRGKFLDLDFFVDRWPNALALHGELKSHMRGKFPDLDFFVDRWPDPQAATAIVDPNGEQCQRFFRNKIVGVAAENGEALRSLLTHCPYMDWTQPVQIEGVAATVEPFLKPLIKEEQHVLRCVLMKATPSDMKPVPAPDGMKISTVTDTTVDIMNSTWRYQEPYSSAYIRYLVRHYPSVVMTTACEQHVGHVLGCSDGTIGIFYVMPQFRRGGYGKAIISQIAQKYFIAGEDAFGLVKVGSSTVLSLHLSVGAKAVNGTYSRYSAKLNIPA